MESWKLPDKLLLYNDYSIVITLISCRHAHRQNRARFSVNRQDIATHQLSFIAGKPLTDKCFVYDCKIIIIRKWQQNREGRRVRNATGSWEARIKTLHFHCIELKEQLLHCRLMSSKIYSHEYKKYIYAQEQMTSSFCTLFHSCTYQGEVEIFIEKVKAKS